MPSKVTGASGDGTIDWRGASSTIPATQGREGSRAPASERKGREYATCYGSVQEGYPISERRRYLSSGAKSLGNSLSLRDPTYYLYHHATELALKACLLSHDVHNTGRHNIGDLFERCRTNKFLGLNDAHFELHNLIVLLEGGNSRNRYRYAVENNHFAPALPWVQEAVGQLFEAVEPQVLAWAKKNNDLPAPSTKWLYFGKPSYEKQPVPSKPGP